MEHAESSKERLNRVTYDIMDQIEQPDMPLRQTGTFEIYDDRSGKYFLVTVSEQPF